MKEKLGISVVNWEDLGSKHYFGLLSHPDWSHLELQRFIGAQIVTTYINELMGN